MAEPAKEVKLQLIENEIKSFENGLYMLSVRHRVNKKLNNSSESLKALEDEMVKTEQAIDELRKMQAEVAQGK